MARWTGRLVGPAGSMDRPARWTGRLDGGIRYILVNVQGIANVVRNRELWEPRVQTDVL
jgi:hypothetical protein